MITNGKQPEKPAGINEDKPEKTWDNPQNPEKAEDKRDLEQMKRLEEEAKRRKENLTDDEP